MVIFHSYVKLPEGRFMAARLSHIWSTIRSIRSGCGREVPPCGLRRKPKAKHGATSQLVPWPKWTNSWHQYVQTSGPNPPLIHEKSMCSLCSERGIPMDLWGITMFEISAWQNGRFQMAPGLKIEEIPAAGHLEFTGSHTLATPKYVSSASRAPGMCQPAPWGLLQRLSRPECPPSLPGHGHGALGLSWKITYIYSI